ncbi:hypothetical protein PI124_g20415 [Phytophthora idaei]|nr:hypothetical protein PI125_g21336 [Phytophthora idaei]KAG3142986.1 hypothetical protein PI126_g14823 [Phytophthora idaei]KAG3234533.1 hypothetical protein PI124_g20415 [Phytophthora idaei]
MNHYVSGSFYVILEVKALASKGDEHPTDVSIFGDNGSSLNGVTEDLAMRLQLDITEHRDDMMTVDWATTKLYNNREGLEN